MSGQKTIEVRKKRPQMDVPFKVYVYCTKGAKEQFWTGPKYSYADDHSHNAFDKCGSGKVIGEFLCNQIISINGAGRIPSDIARPTCLEPAELHQYLGAAVGFGWHISNLKIYDHPRDLWEFTGLRETKFGLAPGPITRPPQSWRYVEEELWND